MITIVLFILLIAFIGLSSLINWHLKLRFEKYAQTPSVGRKSGKEIAEEMMQSYGIYHVSVECIDGILTDHYNSTKRSINLSPHVYHGRNIAAVAVAAHECGHALQDSHSFRPFKIRSAMAPMQHISSKILNAILIALFLVALIFPDLLPLNFVLLITIGCYAFFTFFALITLPVEIDASNRAFAYLSSMRMSDDNTHVIAKDALKWAAFTYVIAAAASFMALMDEVRYYRLRKIKAN